MSNATGLLRWHVHPDYPDIHVARIDRHHAFEIRYDAKAAIAGKAAYSAILASDNQKFPDTDLGDGIKTFGLAAKRCEDYVGLFARFVVRRFADEKARLKKAAAR